MNQNAFATESLVPPMTTASTPVCPLGDASDPVKFKFSKNGFNIYENTRTGLLFVYPVPTTEELNKIYSEEYFSRGRKYTPPAGDRTADPQLRNDQRKIALLRKHHAGTRLLDVGSAMGGFMKVAANEGFDVEGVEVSKFGADYTRNELKLKVHCSTLKDAHLPSASFDVVTMWDVIEHLPDPAENIGEVARILRPGGLCFITTGDVSALYARMLGKRWHLLTPPQHLFYFTPTSISEMVEQHGLAVRETKWVGKHASIDFALFKLGETCGPLANPLRALTKKLGLSNSDIYVNLRDIMTVVVEKARIHPEK